MDPYVFIAEDDIPELGIRNGDRVVAAPWRSDWLAIRRSTNPNPGMILGLVADGRLRHLTPDRPLAALLAAVGSDLPPDSQPPGPRRPWRAHRPPHLHRLK